MLLFDGILGILGIVAFGLWVYCVIDVVTTRHDQVRNLPKLGWLAVVIVFAAIGSVAWLVFGRPSSRQPALVGATRPAMRRSSPDDDEDFLASLDARMQQQRRNLDHDDPPPA